MQRWRVTVRTADTVYVHSCQQVECLRRLLLLEQPCLDTVTGHVRSL